MVDEALLIRIAEKLEGMADRDQSSVQRTFRTIWQLEAEVNNGGFRQYFFNTTGRDAPVAPLALREIGAGECADLVDRALATVNFFEIDPVSDKNRQDMIDNINDTVEGNLSDLDGEFYTYPDNLSDLLMRFVTLHIAEFRL